MSLSNDKINIGGVPVGRVWLAPMAGYTDIAFRTLAIEHGAALTVTEMASTRGFVHGGEGSRLIAKLAPIERPSCVQIFGSDPKDFALTAKMLDCDIIDINMGCPMPKIVKNGDGAALLKNPKLAGEIVRAVKDATDRPVTVKTRIGYYNGVKSAGELIDEVARAGAAAVTVHGRYAEQRYEGANDFDAIEELKNAFYIQIIASGDITRDNLGEMLNRFPACMIGRAALCDIGVFSGESVNPVAVARRHIELLEQNFDERYTINQARKFFVHYFKGVKGGKALRGVVNAATSVKTILNALDDFEKSNLED